MKRALQVASVASMIDQFNMPNIKMLQEMGYKVDVATNFTFGSTTSKERVTELKKELENLDVDIINLLFDRKVFNKVNFKVYRQLKRILEKNNYDIIHCHSPIGGVLTRLAAKSIRKKGTRVIYTAHGFHFFKGASLKNWLLYYPVEKFLSRYTDVLITINNEDYERARRKFKAKRIEYVPGVGIDLEKINSIVIDKEKKREELGIEVNADIILSVGELNKNKNHETIIKALGKRNNSNVHYLICGQGDRYDYLKKLSYELGLGKQVHLLGYRDDVIEICKASDVFVFPSYREGLGLAALEAMACGLPIVTSNVHGINDYSEDNITGFKCSPNDDKIYLEKIGILLKDGELNKKVSLYNVEVVKKYGLDNINNLMKKIYSK